MSTDLATPPPRRRPRQLARFADAVVDLAYRQAALGEVLVLHDGRGEVAAVLPAAEYRRLRRLAGEAD